MAGEVEVERIVVKFIGDTASFVSAADAAKKKSEEFGKSAADAGTKAAPALDGATKAAKKGGEGFLELGQKVQGTATKLLSFITIGPAIVGAITGAITAILEFSGAMKRAERQLEDFKQINASYNDQIRELTTVLLDQGSMFATTSQKVAFYNETMDETAKSLAKARTDLVAAKEAVDEWGPTFDKTKEKVVGLNDEVKALDDRMKLLIKERDKLTQPTNNVELVRGINQFNESLKVGIDRFGESAEEVALYQLQMKGATAAQLEHSKSLMKVLAAMQEGDTKRKEGIALTEQYRTEEEKMVITQEKLRESFDKGRIKIDTFNRAMIDADPKLRKAQENVKEYIKSLDDAGDALTASVATPLEKLTLEVQKYDEMLAKNKINRDTYDRAIFQAGKNYEESAGKAEELRKEMERIENVASGSADALAKIEEFRNAVSGRSGMTGKAAVATAQQAAAALPGNNPELDQSKIQTAALLQIRDLLKNNPTNKIQIGLK